MPPLRIYFIGSIPYPGGTPEGTRDIMEQTPSCRRLATVRRTDRLYLRGRKFIHTLTGCA